MKKKGFDAVKFMRDARQRVGKELSKMSEKEQLKFLREKYGHLAKHKDRMDKVIND